MKIAKEITYLSSEWYEMMLAQRKDVNVPDNHHLIMVFVKDSPIDDVAQVLLVPFCEEHEGLCMALGCTQ